MENNRFYPHPVAVIGAGPAGIFAARTLADAGLPVALINRDIKPGGLAEYGIYYDKYRMKLGLRNQFQRIIESPGIHYYGNVTVAENGALSLADLKHMGFKAVMVTVGAQGTKWLGLPGENLDGVYHAKDLVYHYNQLPPYSTQHYKIGEKVVLVGAGNVMLDIARYCIRDLKVKQVTTVVRRGPADVKFDKKEMQSVIKNLDQQALDAEISKAAPVMVSVGQDPMAAKAFILSAVLQAEETGADTNFSFRFLATPKAIVGDQKGKVTGLEIEHTTLKMRKGGRTSAVGLGTTEVIEADTVIFCIGDQVSPGLGLPLNQWGEYAKNPDPNFPIDGTSYEAYDEQAGHPVKGVFLAGWAREASSGLVGTARKDGQKGAEAILGCLASLKESLPQESPIELLEAALSSQTPPVVRNQDILRLAEAEAARAEELGIDYFKFKTNEEMYQAMGLLVMCEEGTLQP
ncbi:MAG: FAD-dependent oxidoreductase [Anaerolineales bacterium]|nr:FAD-dependent oxidoreductase [Anaerolineales bacterium]